MTNLQIRSNVIQIAKKLASDATDPQADGAFLVHRAHEVFRLFDTEVGHGNANVDRNGEIQARREGTRPLREDQVAAV